MKQILDELGAVGVTLIISTSYLLRPLQLLGKPFDCPMCMGVWIGAVIAFARGARGLAVALAAGRVALLAYTVHLLWLNLEVDDET